MKNKIKKLFRSFWEVFKWLFIILAVVIGVGLLTLAIEMLICIDLLY